MSTPKDQRVFIDDILSSIAKIEKYVENMNVDQFVSHEMAFDAVIRNLEIIGEACKHISEDTRKKAPTVKWSSVVGLRNTLIHEYFGVDYTIIWKIINDDLPELKDEIEKL